MRYYRHPIYATVTARGDVTYASWGWVQESPWAATCCGWTQDEARDRAQRALARAQRRAS